MSTNKYLKYKNKYLNLKKQHGGINRQVLEEKFNELSRYKEEQLEYIDNFQSQIMDFVDNELIDFINSQKKLLNMVDDYVNEIRNNLCSVCNSNNTPVIISSGIIYKKPSYKSSTRNRNPFIQSNYEDDEEDDEDEVYEEKYEEKYKKKQTLNDLILDLTDNNDEIKFGNNNESFINIEGPFINREISFRKMMRPFENNNERFVNNNTQEQLFPQEPREQNDKNFNKMALGTAAGAAALSMFL